jgi:integrase
VTTVLGLEVALRERVLWQMLYETAARAEEVLMLDVPHLDTANRRAVVTRKGGAKAVVVRQTGTARLPPRAAELFDERTAEVEGGPFTLHQLRHSALTHAERRGVASDATFRVRREAGTVRAADSVPPRRQPIMDEKVQVRQVHKREVAAGDSMCHRVLLHRKTA